MGVSTSRFCVPGHFGLFDVLVAGAVHSLTVRVASEPPVSKCNIGLTPTAPRLVSSTTEHLQSTHLAATTRQLPTITSCSFPQTIVDLNLNLIPRMLTPSFADPPPSTIPRAMTVN